MPISPRRRGEGSPTRSLFGLRDGQIKPTPLAEVRDRKKTLDLELLELARVMAT